MPPSHTRLTPGGSCCLSSGSNCQAGGRSSAVASVYPYRVVPTQSQPRAAARRPLATLSTSAISGAPSSRLARPISCSNSSPPGLTRSVASRAITSAPAPHTARISCQPGVMYTELSGKLRFHRPTIRASGQRRRTAPICSGLSSRTPRAPLRRLASAMAAITSGWRMGEPSGA